MILKASLIILGNTNVGVAIKLLKNIEMEKLFVPFELAVKLKEKGFDEECLGVFHKGGNLKVTVQANFPIKNSELIDYVISAPLYDQVFAWFREKHNIKAYIDEYDQFHIPYIYMLGDFPARREYRQKHPTFEKTKEACIELLLTMI